MRKWTILAIILGLVILASIAVSVTVFAADPQSTATPTPTTCGAGQGCFGPGMMGGDWGIRSGVSCPMAGQADCASCTVAPQAAPK